MGNQFKTKTQHAQILLKRTYQRLQASARGAPIAHKDGH